MKTDALAACNPPPNPDYLIVLLVGFTLGWLACAATLYLTHTC